MMRSWLPCLGLAALFLSSDITAADEQGPTKGAVHTVVIENMQFTPAELSVHRGERIVWVNKDLFPHTATAASHAFDSGGIAAGSSWTYVASKAGEYAYGCTFHPTMKAILKVQ
jgi:plastocyanin